MSRALTAGKVDGPSSGRSEPACRSGVALTDDLGPHTPLPLPAERTWTVGIILACFFAVFAAIDVSQILAIDVGDVSDVFTLMMVLFQVFWVIGWSVGVVILFLLAVLLLFHSESARIAGDRLIYVPRLGPLRVFVEYDLTKVRNVRLKKSKNPELAKVRFDYGASDHSLGNEIPIDLAEAHARTIAAAVETSLSEERGRVAAGGGPATSHGFPPAPGWDLTRWIPTARAERGGDRSGGITDGTRSADHTKGRPPVTSTSALSLVAANVIPLAGVLLMGWNLGEVMVLFWAENAIVGFYNVLKLIKVAKWGALFLGPFFGAHYGGFMAGHFIFVYAFFVEGTEMTGTGQAAGAALADLFFPLWPALVALFISHGVSFYTNFLRAREFEARTSQDLMSEPYKRVVILHVTIIFGGMLVLLLGSAVPALILLLALKASVDLAAHRQERMR